MCDYVFSTSLLLMLNCKNIHLQYYVSIIYILYLHPYVYIFHKWEHAFALCNKIRKSEANKAPLVSFPTFASINTERTYLRFVR